MSRKQGWRQHQRGASMVEVLVAVLVLSFGLVGISALQARAIKNSSSAVVRGDLAQLSVAFGESLRANPFNARGSTNPTCSATPAEDALFYVDYYIYFGTFFAADKGTAGARFWGRGSSSCTNTVDWSFRQNWNDSRGVGGGSNVSIGLYYRF